MTKEEYIRKMNENEDWAPGWDVIDEEFSRLYPGQKPDHYATLFLSRAIAGGDEYLDGFSFYNMGNGCYHIVSYGMTELYGNEDAFGQEYSGWGYEMTMKIKADSPNDCLWVMHMISNLARYTNATGRYFEIRQYINGNGSPLHVGTNSKITALITVSDTSAKLQDSLHGKVDFIQLVGITQQELMAIREDIDNLQKLIDLMKKDNPELITDMKRTKSYL